MPTMGTTAASHCGNFILSIARILENVTIFGFPRTVRTLSSEEVASLRLQEKNRNLPEHLAKLLEKQTYHAPMDFNATRGMLNVFTATFSKWFSNDAFL